MSNDNIELTRRKLLAGVGAVGAAGAGAGVGTSALFSDEESFESNELSAGTLDMAVEYSETVVQGETTTNGSGTLDGSLPGGQFSIGDVKPGDYGEIAFTFTLDDNDGYVWLFSTFTPSETGDENENEVVEPEGEAATERDRAVELADRIAVEMWYDDGNGTLDGGETVFFRGNLREALHVLGVGSASDAKDGIPLDANPSSAEDAPAAFAGASEHYLGVRWAVPKSIGNEIQTDSLTFDLGFYAEQARNNSRTHTVSGGDDLQAAVDDADAGDVLTLDGGSYTGPVAIDKPQLTVRAASSTSPSISATDESGATKNQKAALRIGSQGYGTVVDGVDVTRTLDPDATNGDSNSKAVGIRGSETTLRNAAVTVENPEENDEQATGVFVANDTVGFGSGRGVAYPALHDVTVDATIESAGNRSGVTGVTVASLTPYGYPFGSTPYAGVDGVDIGGSIDDAGVGVLSGAFSLAFGPAAPVAGLDTADVSFGGNVGTTTDSL
jgi:predicted ribosomally synthesized peptide with SipW-like signal peptide